MANSLKTDDIIREALVLLKNNIVMADKVDRQLDNDFEGKVGDTIRVRRKTRFAAVSGPDVTGAIADIVEGTVAVQLQHQRTVPFEISSKELTLDIDEFSSRYLEPAVMELVQQVESEIGNVYTSIPGFVGTPGTIPSTFLNLGDGKVYLDEMGVPIDRQRCGFFTPEAAISLADGLKGVFPSNIATRAIEQATIGNYVGFDIIESQSLPTHTVGNYGGTPLVDGASQDVTYDSVKDTYSQTLVTDGWTNSTTGILKAGDVFTIDGVNAVNQPTRNSTGKLRTFTVLADADSGATTGPATLTITPPIITSGAQQTVDAAPADDAAISVVSGTANASYGQNLLFHRNAITLAMANLAMPMGGANASRESMDGISVRVVMDYDALRDVNIIRLDVLFGVVVQNHLFAVRMTN